MKLLEVPLRDIIEAPRSQRVRDPDDAFIAALTESFKAGSEQQTPIPAYPGGGKYHAIGGNHQLAAMKVAFGEDSDRKTWVRVLSFDKRGEAVLEAAKDNNHRDMTMPEWQGVFAHARGLGWTQEKIARWFGVKQPFVSQALNYETFSEHRKDRNAQKPSLTVNNSSDLNFPPLQADASPPVQTETGESDIPTDGGPHHDAAQGIVFPSKGADDGDKDSLRSLVTQPSLQAPLFSTGRSAISYVRAFSAAAEPVLRRSIFLKAQDGKQARSELEGLYKRVGNFLMALDSGEWVGESPKPKFIRNLPTYRQGERVSVEVHGESRILKILEDGRFRIEDERGKVQVIPGSMILAGVTSR